MRNYWLIVSVGLVLIISLGWIARREAKVAAVQVLPAGDASCVVDGYPERFSAFQGERLKFYLNFRNDADVTLKLVDAADSVVDSVNFFGYIQSKVSGNSYVNGYGYKKTFAYRVPRHLKSGLYHWQDTQIWFIVKQKSRSSEIVLVYPSNTEQAYNNAGGKSLYDFNSSDGKRAHVVSFQRPINYQVTPASDIHDFTRGILSWLLDTKYDYRLISDQDLDNAQSIAQAKLIVVIGHSEYWSRAARTNIDSFNLHGGRVAILSGNTMCWQVRYADKGNCLVCYKDSALDPVPDKLLETVQWYEPYLNSSVLTAIGADFKHGGYGTKPDHGWDGYKVISPNSPLLAGTNIIYNEILPLRTHEFDGTALSVQPDTAHNPVPDLKYMNAYRLEIIGYDLGHCHFTNCNSVQTFIAYQRDSRSGALVNTASTNWCSTEAFYGASAINFRTITANIFDLLLKNENVFSSAEVKSQHNK